eukprot:8808472-Lingulodinium_polyedra.AAC.1
MPMSKTPVSNTYGRMLFSLQCVLSLVRQFSCVVDVVDAHVSIMRDTEPAWLSGVPETRGA